MAGNDNNEFNNLLLIRDICDDIVQKHDNEEENENKQLSNYDFNIFFNTCESIIDSSCNQQIQTSLLQPSTSYQVGSGTQISTEDNRADVLEDNSCNQQIRPSLLQPSTSYQVGSGTQTSTEATSTDVLKDKYERYFSVISNTENHVRRFNLKGKRTKFSLVDPPISADPVKWFKNSLKNVVKYVTESIPGSDFVGMILYTPRLEHGPAWISFRRADQLHIDIVWDAISNILQSNANMFTDGEFEIELTRVSVPAGRGKHLNGKGLEYAELCRRKKGIIEIINNDNMCLPRALVVAESWVKKEAELDNIINNRLNIQVARARTLLLNANVNIPVEGAGLSEVKEFQRYLSDYNIVVYEYGGNGSVIFEGFIDTNLPRINLLYHNNHYNVIKSLTAAFSTSYFCEPCHKPYKCRGKHRCANICAYCHHAPSCSAVNESVLCNKCNRRFRGQQCFDNHTGFVCNNMQRCTVCLKLYNKSHQRQHMCGETFCKLCTAYKPAGHKCYITIDRKLKNDKKNNLFIYYDFETRQEKIEGNNRIHEVNLCASQQSCSVCSGNPDLNLSCSLCGVRQHIFKLNPVASFVQYVCNPRPMFNKITCIAHNAKSFDSQFILNI